MKKNQFFTLTFHHAVCWRKDNRLTLVVYYWNWSCKRCVITSKSLSKHKILTGELISIFYVKMCEIELSSVVIDGLKSLNSVISLDLTNKIISNAIKMALQSDASRNKNMINEKYCHKILHLCSIFFAFLPFFFWRYSIESRNLCNKTNLHKTSRLTCDVKSSQIDATTGTLNFCINFGRYRELSGEREMITEFVCNAEELQYLIGCLKEIERHCERS